jgi:hypothetical protein
MSESKSEIEWIVDGPISAGPAPIPAPEEPIAVTLVWRMRIEWQQPFAPVPMPAAAEADSAKRDPPIGESMDRFDEKSQFNAAEPAAEAERTLCPITVMAQSLLLQRKAD